ncbi:hypothetical protein Q668_20930 [Alcanivorax sp. PN-3]|nr:hypothetical protein Q668_20930 [Alcanivorax sp. PN-3]
MVTVFFRTDASTCIGTGHVMRCLTLAKALKEQGAECAFIGREHPGHLLDLLEKEGFACHRLPAPRPTIAPGDVSDNGGSDYAFWLGVPREQDANDCLPIIKQSQPDWLVVDHYALDADWEQRLRPHVGKIMVIDDLANRSHDCDLLLDQNLGRKASDYADKVPAACKVLTGPEFALLRPEFAAHRDSSLARRRTAPSLTHILVTMGGVDAHNATGSVLCALAKSHLPEACRISVVMGAKAPWLQQVQARAAAMPYQTEVLSGINNMAETMSSADLCIGAAGSTSWERCALGLPSLTVVLADNQEAIADALSQTGAALALTLTPLEEELPRHIARLQKQPGILKSMSDAAAGVTSGAGVATVMECLQ